MSTNFMPTGGFVAPEKKSDENMNVSKEAEQTCTQEAIHKDGAEQTLKVIATIVLIVGIIFSSVVLIRGASEMSGYKYDDGYSFLGDALSILTISVVAWAFLKVICNISNNLHQINSKMKK